MNSAIMTLSALTTLALRSAEAANEVSQMIAAAQSGGRDLTTAERETIEAKRKAAVAEWHRVTGD
tara:strand:- start:208 stop:402 length:195 start_codon:yes stop_codon:yes gene_type:complete